MFPVKENLSLRDKEVLLNKNINLKKLKCGDIIHNIYEGEYINGGFYTFNGKKLISFDIDIDEYGIQKL